MVKKTIATIGLSAMAISMSSIEASAMEKGAINTSALNIRSGPSTDYKRIDKAYKGQTVEILEKSNGWYKVKLSNGTVGWASGQYISLGGNSSTSIEGKRGKITASPRLNIRSGAGTNYSIVGKANYGEAVDLLEKSNGWYKVKLSNGTVGWGSGDYVIETTEKPGNNTDNNTNNQQPPTTTPLEGKRGKITANPRLNVRSGAGTNYSIVGKANYGDVVELVEKTNGWYKVKLSNGTVGFGSGDYIVEATEQPGNNTDNNTNNQQPPTTTPVEGKRGKITASPRLNIRSGAGTSYSIVGKANYGEVVELVEKTNGWYKIKLSNGVVGWGSSDYVVETTEKPGNSTDDNTNNQQPPVTSNRSEVVNLAYGLLGKPYAWGAEGPNSFDCSGFTKYVYKQAEGKTIPRVSRDQARYGTAVSRNNYAPGDLVYFDTDGDGVVNHVGVYVGGNEFIHCSGTPTNPDKVKKDSLGSLYWSKVLVGARRF